MIINPNKTFGFLDIDKQAKAPLFLSDFGMELRQDEPYDFNNEKRGSYSGFLIQYTLEGCGIIESNGTEYSLTPGSAFFITFPDSSRYYLPEGGKWKFFYLHFDGELGDYFYKRIQNTSGNIFSLDSSSQAINCFLEEYQTFQNGRKYDRYESGIFLYRFLSTLLRELEIPSIIIKNAVVEEAAEWIRQNYRSQNNLSQMCSQLGVSLPHLTRQFHSQKGITPMKYLTQLRLEQGISFLLNTTLNIDVIAQECGFANGNYFAKVFRKSMGVSPSEYRISHLGHFPDA